MPALLVCRSTQLYSLWVLPFVADVLAAMQGLRISHVSESDGSTTVLLFAMLCVDVSSRTLIVTDDTACDMQQSIGICLNPLHMKAQRNFVTNCALTATISTTSAHLSTCN